MQSLNSLNSQKEGVPFLNYRNKGFFSIERSSSRLGESSTKLPATIYMFYQFLIHGRTWKISCLIDWSGKRDHNPPPLYPCCSSNAPLSPPPVSDKYARSRTDPRPCGATHRSLSRTLYEAGMTRCVGNDNIVKDATATARLLRCQTS